MSYYADVGPERGPILWRDNYDAINVLEAPDNHTPIGMALGVGWGPGGVQRFRLIVHGVDVPGRWTVVGQEFWPEELTEELGGRAPR
jgi:hypothetical protein